jgi:hypothetical protein
MYRGRLPRRFSTAIAVVVLAFAGGAPAALADTSESSNWAGYAVHRAGVSFSSVTAVWKQPSARCVRGSDTYSAVWVGLGGFSVSSNALEQIGTEVDCSPSGIVQSSAWYELVPAPSQPISLRVRAGDQIDAIVTVNGNRVVVTLLDATTHKSFTKPLAAPAVDVSSAEWIVEAPSNCINIGTCQTLPLANFGSTTFNLAAAVTTSGHTGSISDPAWDNTKISLVPNGRRFISYEGSAAAFGGASPSPLSAGGQSFKVTFSRVGLQARAAFASGRSLSAGYLVHPGR